MGKKTLLICIAAAVIASGIFISIRKQEAPPEHNKTGMFIHKEVVKNDEQSIKASEKTVNTQEKQVQISGEIEKTSSVRHGNLYETFPAGNIPLSAISELAGLPQNVSASVNKIIDNSNGIYMLKRNGDKLLVVTENQDNIRHGVDFIEISIPTGHQTRSTLGYNGKIQDSENDIWEYDQNSPVKAPVKHTKFDKNGDVEFIETWSYDSSNPIKYEMKNAEGKTLSMRKETIKDNTDMRVEHLIYDEHGNTKVNLTTTFEGADIKRFTYYNADKLSDSESIFGEYKDGVKIRETVYTPELKVKNVYEASYIDGSRQNVKVLDSSNNVISTIEK